MKPKEARGHPITYNRRARYNYEILETFNAGLSLKGAEVKSIRAGNVSITESFGKIDKGEVFLYNMYIAPYSHSREEIDPRRSRKLLLHKQELIRLSAAVNQKGLALIPLKVYFRRGWAKVEVALGKGKRKFDKRETIRRREAEREMKGIRK